MAKPKPKQSDKFLPYIVATALTVVVIGFVAAWFYFKQNNRLESQVAYATFGPMVVSGSSFSIRATVTVQTDSDHASWLNGSRQSLNLALQNALTQTDPQRVRKSDGILYLQGMLRDAANGALQTKNVHEILLTDFIIQSE
ncbi:MAG TPA: flagellar basal body-associated FliL family protein [Herminiimonas sp.]|nr:flagellar basal body-associated FliL family protein [Herminiimonas sp.]